MKLFNNENHGIDLRNRIIFIWKAILMDIENMLDLDVLSNSLIKSADYRITMDTANKVIEMVNKLPHFHNSFLSYLRSGNQLDAQEQYNFMCKYSKEVIQEIDKVLHAVGNQSNNTDKIQISRITMPILLNLRTRIIEFMQEFEAQI